MGLADSDLNDVMQNILTSGIFEEETVFACPHCDAQLDFSNAVTVTCECGAKLRRPMRLTHEHYSIIARYSEPEEREHWTKLAQDEELTPARLRAEIKYTSHQVYRSRSTNGRRGKKEIENIRAAIYQALKEDQPMTVRQVFYRLVTSGVIGKTEAEYKGTIVRLLSDMRRAGEVPFSWIADNTRWMRKPRTYSSLENMLKISAEAYRRAVWDNQEAYVEIWLEKDALAGVLMEETSVWDVPLMVTRGYPSLSYLHSAAETIAEQGKPVYLYYFGDYDPSGLDIPRKVESDLREFAEELSPGVEIHFERVAVTREQIESMNLPTRPTKRTDTRAKNFVGESVEVDAIPPRVLRKIVSECITQHIDERAYEVLKEAEASERETLQHWIGRAA